MRLEQFEYLIAIKNYKTIHAASRELHISQQSISKAMQDLESELNTQLLTRSTKGTVLTKDGEETYQHALNIIQEVNLLKNKFVLTHNNENIFNATLKVYISNNISNLLSVEIDQFYKKYNSQIQIMENWPQKIINLLENTTKCELAFIQTPISELVDNDSIKANYECYMLKNERLKLFINKQSEYAHYSSISIKTLEKIPLFLGITDEGLYPLNIKPLIDNNVNLNAKIFTSEKYPMKYVERNQAGVLGTRLNFQLQGAPSYACMVPLKDKIYISTCLLVRKDSLTPISKTFVQTILRNKNYKQIF